MKKVLILLACLFALAFYSEASPERRRELFVRAGAVFILFAALTLALRENMYLNILSSVLFVAAELGLIYIFRREKEAGR